MDKLKLDLTGRMPLLLEDLKFQDDYLREAIESILKPFDNVSGVGFIVHGCEFDFNSRVLTAGYIYLNGELIKVDSHHVAQGAGNVYITKQATDGTSRTFGDSTSKNVRTVVRGIGGYASSQPENSVAITDNLIKRIMSVTSHESWQQMTLASGFTHGSPTLKYRKNKVGNVEISGSISGPEQAKIATLPSGYRPSYDLTVPIVTGDCPNNLFINASNGEMTIDGVNQIFNLSGNQVTNIHFTIFIT